MAMGSPVAVPAAPKESAVASVPASKKPAAAKPAAKPVLLAQADTGVRSDVTPRMAPTRRREQLKMIEDQPLAESTLADLKRAAAIAAAGGKPGERKGVGSGTRVTVRVDSGGRRYFKNKQNTTN